MLGNSWIIIGVRYKTDFPVLATSPTMPSPLSKISEARIFSKKLARVLEDL